MRIVRIFLLSFLLVALGGLAPQLNNPLSELKSLTDSDFYHGGQPSPAKVALGQALFFDKELSGNRNISCATCHHPNLGSGDGVALSFGEGARGLGPDRRVGPETPVLGRVPRNAQPLYFVGATGYRRLFHDGRVEVDANNNWPSGFWSPAREQLPEGLDNVLAVQAMFPVLSHIEMAGHKGENEIATAVAKDELAGPDGAWALLARRLAAIPRYVALFQAAYPEVKDPEDITFVQAANAIAAFETVAFRADDSPFDRFLKTRDQSHLTPAARRGMALFYGEARCAHCHSGALQTDQDFHAIAMPQIGPGKNDGFDRSYWRATGFMARLEDEGRYKVTRDPADRFKFRTPSLRNVELTGPWGHAGSYRSLEAVVRHHVDPVAALNAYRAGLAELPPLAHINEKTAVGSQLIHRPVNPARLIDYLRRDTWVQQSPKLRGAIAAANELEPRPLTDRQVADIVAFLKALTDPASRDAGHLIPASVPSGLPVQD
ncbi:MAG: cytochrome c peroxidase [Pseudomonadota bacterium]